MRAAIFFFLGIITITFFLGGCQDSTVENTVKISENETDGLALMEKNCYSCHNTQGTDNMLAPPMQRVKDHYLDENTTKDEFVSSIVEWCENPNEEDSRMPGARNKFGLMPKQEFDSKEIEIIAAYLFENDLDQSCSH